jgi:hypothetical protein
MARGPISVFGMVVGFGAICLSVAILAYRVEVDRGEVRVRYMPFYTKRVPIRDVTGLTFDRMFVLVTPTSRIRLPRLPDDSIEALYRIFPDQFKKMEDAETEAPVDRGAIVRRYRRWATIAGVGFLASAALATPFFKGNALDKYRIGIGEYVFFLCLCFFLAFVALAGFTWVLWSAKRDLDEPDEAEHKHPKKRR